MLVVFRAPGVRELLLLAYNVDAAEWLVRTTPRSNLVGAFGMFGGALMARRWVVFQ